MDAHDISAGSVAAGHGFQRTMPSEVDPTQRRSPELERQTAVESATHRDRGTQTSSYHTTSSPLSGLTEKGIAIRGIEYEEMSRKDSIDSNSSAVSAFSARPPRRSNTTLSTFSTVSIANSVITEDTEPPSRRGSPEPDESVASASLPQTKTTAVGAGGKHWFPWKKFQSPAPTRSSSTTSQDPDASGPVVNPLVNLTSLPRSSSPSEKGPAAMPKLQRPAPKHIRFDPSVLRRRTLPFRPHADQHELASSTTPSTEQIPASSQEFKDTQSHQVPSRPDADWDAESSTPTPTIARDGHFESAVGLQEPESAQCEADPMKVDSSPVSSHVETPMGTPTSPDDTVIGESPGGGDPGLLHQSDHDPRCVDELCDLILQQTHGLRLQDLARPQDAWVAVNYCLEELSRIVEAQTSLPRETPAPCGQRLGYGEGSSGYQQYWSPNGNPDDHNGDGNARKRDWGDDRHPTEKGPGEGGSHGGGNGSNGGAAGGKRPRLETPNPPSIAYSCPYRKWKPLDFNIRSHTACATVSFQDISQVKRHVKNIHFRSRGFRCDRCKRIFPTPTNLTAHLQVPVGQICEVREEEPDNHPEWGISQKTVEELNDRKAESKISDWNSLWVRLFGADQPVPEPHFEPPVEWDEVKAEFDDTITNLHPLLHRGVQTFGLGNATEGLVAGQMALTCTEFIYGTINNSRQQALQGYSPKRRIHRKTSSASAAPSLVPGQASQLSVGYNFTGASSNGGSSPAEPAEPVEGGPGPWNQTSLRVGTMPQDFGHMGYSFQDPAAGLYAAGSAQMSNTYTAGAVDDAGKGKGPVPANQAAGGMGGQTKGLDDFPPQPMTDVTTSYEYSECVRDRFPDMEGYDSYPYGFGHGGTQ